MKKKRKYKKLKTMQSRRKDFNDESGSEDSVNSDDIQYVENEDSLTLSSKYKNKESVRKHPGWGGTFNKYCTNAS